MATSDPMKAADEARGRLTPEERAMVFREASDAAVDVVCRRLIALSLMTHNFETGPRIVHGAYRLSVGLRTFEVEVAIGLSEEDPKAGVAGSA